MFSLSAKDNISILIFNSFFFFLPISQKTSTLLIVASLLITLVTFKPKNFHYNKDFILLIGFYFIYALSLVYSTTTDLFILEKKASFLAFPIILMLNKAARFDIYVILKWFVLGCLLSVILCEFYALYRSIDIYNFEFNSKTIQNISFFDSLSQGENQFFGQKFSVLHQTVYQSMYLCFALWILSKFKIFKKELQIFMVALIILGILQILNKASFLVMFILICLHILSLTKGTLKKTIFLTSLIIVFVVAFFANPRLREFNYNFNYKKPDKMVVDLNAIPNTNRVQTNTRVLLWMSSIELIKENPLLGIGAGGSHTKLYERVAYNQQHYDRRYKVNSHNQLLQVLLDTGVLGFIIFAGILYALLKRLISEGYKNNNKKLITGFLVVILINFMFESVFERYSGISFFCSFYCLLVSCFPSTTTKNYFKQEVLMNNND